MDYWKMPKAHSLCMGRAVVLPRIFTGRMGGWKSIRESPTTHRWRYGPFPRPALSTPRRPPCARRRAWRPDLVCAFAGGSNLWAKSAGIGLGRTTVPRRACTGAAEPTERPAFQRTCADFVRTATSLLDSAICDAGYPGACHSTLVPSTCGKCDPDCTPQAVAQRIRAAGEKVSRPSKSACTD